MIYTEEAMREAMLVYLRSYHNLGIKKSVIRNGHMNDYKYTPHSIEFITDKNFDEDVIQFMLIQFIDMTIPKMKLDSPKIMDILNALTNNASNFLNTHKTTIPQVIKEAVVVDFINYVASQFRVDLAYYTSDLNTVKEDKLPKPGRYVPNLNLSQYGFTLIELIIALALVSILVTFIESRIKKSNTDSGTLTEYTVSESNVGVTDISETRCIKGYSFVQGSSGTVTQIMDSNGKGIPCSK